MKQRLIDADALKNSIDEHVYLVHHGFNETEYGCTQYGIHQIIDEAPTIEAVPQWIPCSERLPEIKEHYVSETCLVCLDNGAIGFSELQENIFGQVGWSCEREDDYHEPLGDVIAWMPLPRHYEVNND